MPPTPLPVLRAYLKDIDPQFSLPRRLSQHVVLRDPGDAPNIPTDADAIFRSLSRCVLDIESVDEPVAMVLALNTVATIRVASECSLALAGYCTSTGHPIESNEGDVAIWGHSIRALSEDEARFVDRHFRTLMDYLMPTKYSRVGNALRLHREAMQTRNADLALLGFVGAIESLFSIAPQELSFRLSLLLGRFLGENPDMQRSFFDRARDVYSIRSKIAHGDKIASDEETAAVEIVETWVPEAERLARAGLRRILDKDIAAIFDSPERHKRLLTELLFQPSLDDALRVLV